MRGIDWDRLATKYLTSENPAIAAHSVFRRLVANIQISAIHIAERTLFAYVRFSEKKDSSAFKVSASSMKVHFLNCLPKKDDTTASDGSVKAANPHYTFTNNSLRSAHVRYQIGQYFYSLYKFCYFVMVAISNSTTADCAFLQGCLSELPVRCTGLGTSLPPQPVTPSNCKALWIP